METLCVCVCVCAPACLALVSTMFSTPPPASRKGEVAVEKCRF